jgi:diguanylate cyclase (GGDEF)-like protein
MRVLVVEDDEVVAQSLTIALGAHRYTVDVASDGRMGWEYVMACEYDVIVLDIMLPILNGIHFCQQLRSSGSTTPILLVTAHGDRSKLVEGLDAGADDYVVKPFDLKELLARLRALLRRGQASLPPTLHWGCLMLDPNVCEVRWHEKILKLTPKEYSLLELLLRNPQRIYSSSALIDHLWSLDTPPSEDTIRSHVKGLRNKLKAAKVTDDPVETVYGIGYRLRKLPETIVVEAVGNPANPVLANTVLASAKTLDSAALNSKDESQATADRIAAGLATVWQQSQGKLFTRMEHLEQAIAVAQQGLLNASSIQVAEESAHKLAGSLGMFSLDRASDLAKEIEQWFAQTRQGSILALDIVTQNVQELRQNLELMSAQSIDAGLRAAQIQAGLIPESLASSPTETSSLIHLDQRAAEVPVPILLPERKPSEARILILDDNDVVVENLIQVLQPWGFEIVALPVTSDLMAALQVHQPDLLILEVAMGELSGLALCQTLRNTVQWSDLPVLFLTDSLDPELTHRVFAAGADDFVRKPVIGPELITRLLNRLERSRLLRNLAETDSLTQVANRRTLTAQSETFLRIAHRHEKPMCLAIVDLYQLREINDLYGYLCGDEVLKRCAKILKASFRQEDLIGRWSDEKFVIVLYGTEVSGVNHHLLEIVNEFRRQVFVPVNAEAFTANLAVGISEYQRGDVLQSVYDRAKQSLVAAMEFKRSPIQELVAQD